MYDDFEDEAEIGTNVCIQCLLYVQLKLLGEVLLLIFLCIRV